MNRDVAKTLGGVVLVSVAIAAGRIAGGRLLGALGVEADGWHTLADTLALGGAFAGLNVVSSGAYQRLERCVTAALALAMLAVSFELVRNAICPGSQTVELSVAPLAIVLPTVAMQVALVGYQRRAAQRTSSLLLEGNAAHTSADAQVTIAILIGAIVSALGAPWLDRWIGFGVAAAIALSSVKLLARVIRPQR